jgi:hypothetical protein
MNHLLASCFAKIKREYDDDKQVINKAVPYPNNFIENNVIVKQSKSRSK